MLKGGRTLIGGGIGGRLVAEQNFRQGAHIGNDKDWPNAVPRSLPYVYPAHIIDHEGPEGTATDTGIVGRIPCAVVARASHHDTGDETNDGQ